MVCLDVIPSPPAIPVLRVQGRISADTGIWCVSRTLLHHIQIVVKWFELAAEQGEKVAQFNLGTMYDQGVGVTQDYAEAAAWFRLAAEQGYDEAQFNLGFMYAQGQGMPQDYVEAGKWWRLTAEQGIASAKKRLETLEALMTQDQIAEAQRLAREWRPKGK
jgi:TPR repeat protein